MHTDSERESNLRKLADQLMFSVEKTGERYTLTRKADVSRTVQKRDLTIAEAEELLRVWKLRGPHGG